VYSALVQAGRSNRCRCVLCGCYAALLCGAASAQQAVADYLGVDPDLARGAEALELHRFAEGVEYTLRGLPAASSTQNRAAALNNLCAGYAALAKYELAIARCTESLALDPANWQAYNNRALAYLAKGLFELAERDVRSGLALQPAAGPLKKVDAMVQAAIRDTRARDAAAARTGKS
jgi:tetratricopeptide (TPR) repeat protein